MMKMPMKNLALLTTLLVATAAFAQNEVVLNLKKGLNQLLFKVDQKSGAWGLYANFKGDKPAGIKVV